MASSQPPYYPMDSDHRGAGVIVAAFSLIIYTLLTAAIRLCVLRKALVEFHAEDVLTGLAMMLSIVAYVLFYRAVPAGLGLHQANLSLDSRASAIRILYAAQMVSVAAMWAAKLSASALQSAVDHSSSGRRSCLLKVSIVVAVLWGPVCLILTATSCTHHLGCTNSRHQDLVVAGLNMASDVWLALSPLRLVHGLRLPWSRKIRVGLLFTARLIVPGITVGQVLSLLSAHFNPDKTFSYAVEAIWLMLVVFTSVLASVMPRTQRFWSALQSGGAKVTGDHNEREFIWDWKNRLVRTTLMDGNTATTRSTHVDKDGKCSENASLRGEVDRESTYSHST